MRVHGTTPRARSAVHTSLIHAGVKPLYAEPGRTRGTTAHESCTPKLDGKFSGLSYESRPYPGRPPPPTPSATRRISSPPSPPLSSPCPAHYSIHHSSTPPPPPLLLLRTRDLSIGFKGPPRIQEEIEKSASGYRISVSSYPPPLSCFRQEFVDKTMPTVHSPLPPLAVVGCDPSNLPISFFRQGAPRYRSYAPLSPR